MFGIGLGMPLQTPKPLLPAVRGEFAEFRFDEGSGTALHDRWGNSGEEDGTLQGGATWVPEGIMLDGVSGRILFSDDVAWNVKPNLTARTIHIVFKTSADVTTRQPVYNEGGANNGFNFYIRDGSLYAAVWSETNGWSIVWVSAQVMANTWYHVCSVYDGGASSFEGVVDGVSMGTAVPGASVATHTDAPTIGSDDGDAPSTQYDDGESGPNYFCGIVGYAMFYNVALGQEENKRVRAYLVQHMRERGVELFSPAILPGMKLWLDAARITGLSDGDPVASWSDLSGNGLDVAQATASKQPVYKTNVRNGRPVVRFDGVDDVLQSVGQSAAIGSDPRALFVVFIPTSGQLQPYFMSGDDTALHAFSLTWGQDDTDRFVLWSQDVQVDAVADWNMTTFYIRDAVAQGRINGAFAGAPNANTPDTIPGIVEVGGREGGTPAGSLHGDIAEVIYFEAALTDGQIAMVERYLAQKWGVPLA